MVSQAESPFCQHDIFIAHIGDLVDDVFHVFRGHELALFYVDALARLRRRFQKVRLPAEESGNLQDIQHLCRRLYLFDGVDVADDRHA